MLYRLYIYKSTAVAASAPAIGICNRAVSLNSLRDWKDNNAARRMLGFDTRSVAAKIHALVGEKCRVYTKTPPSGCGDVEYLCIATSYACAPAVLPSVHCIAAEHDLVLYDAETGRTFFRNLVNRTYITVKSRIADYMRTIRGEMGPIWRIRKIGVSKTERDYDYAYIVTLRKAPDKSFSARCAAFYHCLNDQLRNDESLKTDNECFTIVGRWYSISFCLEGYKKHPNQMGYYAQGLPKAKLIKRMGCEEGFRWLEQEGENIDAVLDRMNFRELKRAYPNPADRFVASVNIQKWESRNVLDIRYCGIGFYGAEILFHIVPSDFYQDANEISVLAVYEDNAEPILSVVNQFYPYFYERYYLEENHLPLEMWIDIVEAAGKKREECIELRNFRDARLLDVFIRWSNAQFDLYRCSGDNRMFNIQGP